MRLHILEDPENKILKAVRKFHWNKFIPGGWLDYGPPRMVTGYGDGSYYTDDGVKYGFNYGETAWAASIPISTATAIAETKAIPASFLKTGILHRVRSSLKQYGAKVGDHSGSGLWCNYYSERTHRIAAHRDNENYYERNFKNEPLFVSLTLYEDGNCSLDNLARFQIRETNGDWKTVELPHLSLLVMSGNIEHRVLESVKSKPYRKRYNITFRNPIRYDDDLIKNYRFFSNFGRYYRKPFGIYFPSNLDDKQVDKLKRSYNKIDNGYGTYGKMIYKQDGISCFHKFWPQFCKFINYPYNWQPQSPTPKEIRNNLLKILDETLQQRNYSDIFKSDGKRPAKTTTNMALVILLLNLRHDRVY